MVPALFNTLFPSWFAGFAFAAIAIGALVPAAVMSIGAANLFTRNFWKPYVNNNVTPEGEAKVAKMVSLVVKVGALVFIGFRLNRKLVRSTGLAVAALAGLKIVLYDLATLNALYRVGSFFTLAIIALAVAYAYNQRARAGRSA